MEKENIKKRIAEIKKSAENMYRNFMIDLNNLWKNNPEMKLMLCPSEIGMEI